MEENPGVWHHQIEYHQKNPDGEIGKEIQQEKDDGTEGSKKGNLLNNDLQLARHQNGHAAGDDLLKRTSKILHQAFRTDDMVARIGGDEFAVVLPETNEDTVTASVERLMKCLNESNEADSEFKVGLSIGYATTSTDNQLSNVIREADQKMYAEKAEKKRKLDDIF